MRQSIFLLVFLLLSGCTGVVVSPQVEHLFNDRLFQEPTAAISADEIFALSEEMKTYLNTEIAGQIRKKGPQQGLVDALYSKRQLRLEYDSTMTRNAAQAFAARSGNCLSLVIMTAAFAKALGLPVRYQNVFVEENWSRSGELYFASGHVNLSLGNRPGDARFLQEENYLMTIDFQPQSEIRGQRSSVLGEETIVAMFMNNQAAEALARGRLNEAYWWARSAVLHAPKFLGAFNTLGVIYRRHGNPGQAERVFNHVLEREPENTDVMSNLVLALADLGRNDESRLLSRKLEQIQPHPPFHFFNLGLTAMRNGDFQAAKELFSKEIKRAAYNHEFHYWLAAACLRLGETEQARQHLGIALENSTTRNDHEIYAAKLEQLKRAPQTDH